MKIMLKPQGTQMTAFLKTKVAIFKAVTEVRKSGHINVHGCISSLFENGQFETTLLSTVCSSDLTSKSYLYKRLIKSQTRSIGGGIIIGT